MAKTAVKREAVPVPASPEELARFIGQIGEHQRALATIQTGLNDRIERLKAQIVVQTQSHQEAIEQLFEGVFAFAQTHRDELTEGGKTKTAHLPTGDISWRMTPPAVSIRNAEGVTELCKSLGLFRFIRVKEEPDKEAMLKESDIAEKIKGVTISQHEEFVVKPSEVGIEVSGRTEKLQKKTGGK